MRRFKRNTLNTRKTLFLSIIIFVTLFMSVGFSVLNQRLEIVGNANLYATEKYLWHKITNSYGTNTSNGLISNENENNKYSYTGTNPNNYITFNGETWRIISIENDKTIKIIRWNNSTIKEYDETNNRTELSTYCTNLTYGCNSWAIKPVLTNSSFTGNVENNSSLNEYLNTTFYNSILEENKNKIAEHNYNIGAVTTDNNITSVIGEEIEQTWTGKVGLPSISEIMFSTGSTFNLGSASPTGESYITNYSNGSILWTISMLKDNNYQVWTVGPSKTEYSPKNVNLSTETINEVTYNYIVLPVVHLISTVEYNTGSGTVDNPFTIK